MSGATVVVIGDVMVDIVVVPDGPLAPGSDTASTIRTTGGGSAANTACWLAAAGQAASLVAAVGDDDLGRTTIAALGDAGVAWAGAVLPGERSGACVVLVDSEGERTMLPDRGANDRLPVGAVEAAVDRRPAWVHLSGYALLHPGSRAAGRRAVELATKAGLPWSVDASSASPLEALGAEAFLGWIDGCTVLFANDDELRTLGGEAAVRGRVGALVAKHGPEGATWIDAEGRVDVPAVPTTVVDTVGAGDALDAGVIAARLRGLDPRGALEAGTAVAARAVSQSGARPRPAEAHEALPSSG